MLVPLVPTERLDYVFQNNSCDEEKMCGHYTQVGHTDTLSARTSSSWLSFNCVCVCALQMVWADTHRVGCAVHLCNNMEGLSWEKASFLVCNYYPASVLQQHHCCIPTVTTSSAAFILNSRAADTASLCTAP